MVFQNRLRNVITILLLVIILRLSWVAYFSDNWRGFIYSSLHALIVAFAVYHGLKSYDHKN